MFYCYNNNISATSPTGPQVSPTTPSGTNRDRSRSSQSEDSSEGYSLKLAYSMFFYPGSLWVFGFRLVNFSGVLIYMFIQKVSAEISHRATVLPRLTFKQQDFHRQFSIFEVDANLIVMSVLIEGLPDAVALRQERETRKMAVSASEFRRRIGFAMIGLGDDIYIVGGVIGPERWNWDIKLLSDVDVLTLGSERQVWRQVTPMTRCRGTVLGCTQIRI
ncbi:hypothetical protein K7X08_011126 [Anisodus acutangulus]|uniref:Uncharacterized protein n=1 Tax=Anisodus acutangulus TaxID=402998 RepID=A0A9Q1LY55_9SOLA|nr:hypothetical protein K7X08_011126 [Anisodus acutangulus]